jgi:hypothetical protein
MVEDLADRRRERARITLSHDQAATRLADHFPAPVVVRNDHRRAGAQRFDGDEPEHFIA